MASSGSLSHIDISVGYPERSIPFYDAFFGALGYQRWQSVEPDRRGEHPQRATWSIRLPDSTTTSAGAGAVFAVEVRPARPASRDRKYDRYEPGPHHLAFNAASREVVDRAHETMRAIGATVLDPPADYSGRPGYSDGYYAVFFADPDGLKLEIAFIPGMP